MKTRRILAASTAALLAFGATAVVASATNVNVGSLTSVDGDDLNSDIYGITFDPKASGSTTLYTVVGAKDVTKLDADGSGTAYTATTFKDATDALTDADFTSANVDGVTVSIKKADALKLKAQYQVKIAVKEVNEDDDEKVSFEEDEEIGKLKLSKENVDILKKTKASNVKLFTVTVGKNGEVTESIGKNLTVKVAKTWGGAHVYHVNSDGSLNEITNAKTSDPITGGDKETTFTTSTFSPFIVTTAELKATKASTDTSSAAASTASTATASTNPDTGIALAIAPVVLAAGAVAVVALKKKH